VGYYEPQPTTFNSAQLFVGPQKFSPRFADNFALPAHTFLEWPPTPTTFALQQKTSPLQKRRAKRRIRRIANLLTR
jgi:hypothetical protein